MKLAELLLSATALRQHPPVARPRIAITSVTALATSTATWATLVTSGGTRVMDMSVGTAGANLNLNSVAISSGAAIAVSSLVISMGA